MRVTRTGVCVLLALTRIGLGGCSSSAATSPPPSNDGGSVVEEDASSDAGVDDASTDDPHAKCRPLAPPIWWASLKVYYARSPKGASGAWLASYSFPAEYAPFPGAGLGLLMLDRDDALVGHATDLASFLPKTPGQPMRSIPLLMVYPLAVCNGAPPCQPDEQDVSWVATSGTAVVHEHAIVDGGRLELEMWNPVFRRNVAKSGIAFSEDSADCFQSSRMAVLGPVVDVTSQCPTVQPSDDESVYGVCRLATRLDTL